MSSLTDAVCVSAQLFVVRSGEAGLPSFSSEWPAFTNEPRVTVVPAREEFAAPCPSVHDVLRWFERSRSDHLGGPEALQEVTDRGILVVVARIDDFEYVQPGNLKHGVRWEVRTVLHTSKAKLTFDERLIMQMDAEEVAVARALVQCVCIDATTRRITKVSLPELLQ